MMLSKEHLVFWVTTAAMLYAAYYFRDWRPERFRTPVSAVVGKQGEWVTQPDGRRVCRLAYDLLKNQLLDRGFCTDWKEPEPQRGQVVKGWVRSTLGYYQIMIEGTWRP